MNGSDDNLNNNANNSESYVKTPSPPVPIKSSVADAKNDSDESLSSSKRLGQLEDQRRMHSEARQAQAARNSITSIASSARSRKSSASSDKPIRNTPDNHEGDDSADVEKVLDAEMVSDEEISARDMGRTVKDAFFDLCFVLPILFLPTVLLYFFLDEPVYSITKMKNPQYMNPVMECIRYNIFATCAYGLYVILDVLSLVVPEAILVFTPPVTKDTNAATKFIRNQLQLFIYIRKNVAMSAWLISLIPLASWLLYESIFVTPWEVVTKIAQAKAEKAVASATTSADEEKLIADGKTSMMQRNLEIGLVFLAIVSAVMAVEKYLMQMVALNFHSMAFSHRISDVNHRFTRLLKLYEAVKFGKPRVLSNSSINLLDIDSSADLSLDRGLHLTSISRAKSVAKLIYRTLKSPDRKALIPEDFDQWTNQPKETFESLDLDGSGSITAAELEEACIDIYNSRENVFKGLKSNGRIVKKLDSLFIVLALLVAAVLASPIFDVGAGRLLMSIGVLSTGFGFLFHSTAKSCFESLLFVFIQHPFDVGDRVVIDDETFVVDDIEVFTTRMVRWDGITVYINNSSLSSKTIFNIRRSEDQMESLALKLKSDTTTESLWNFHQELRQMLAERRSSFTGDVNLANLDKLPASGEPLSLTVLAQVRGNFQNPAKRNARKTELLQVVESALQSANLTKA